ncbi:hypothetical protein HA402_016134 [Bradysia odoriphaga]|nr:hypothetical protein HA402_016134 [Bradysia odoriphaga]
MQSMFVSGNKVWKEKPAGPEQLLLNEMFETGCISGAATAEAVRKSRDMFKDFSAQVFGTHFRKTKARYGEFVSEGGIKGIPSGVVPETKDEKPSNLIAELGSYAPPSLTKRSRSNNSASVVGASIFNPPYRTWIYTDHQLKSNFVAVAISIFTGSKSITFDVSDDGLKVIAKFSWPSAMHDPDQMFKGLIREKVITAHDAMIHAMASDMLDSGMTETSKLEGEWIIPLPCKVRRETSSYKLRKITYETTTMLFITLTAYQDDVIIENANRTMTFD